MKPKKKILLDITPLQYGYFPDAARSGIFFTLKNILLQLLKRQDIDLFFNLDLSYAPNIEFSVHSVLEREFPEYRDRILPRLFSEVPSRFRIFCGRQNEFITKAKARYQHNPLVFFLLRGYYFLINRILSPMEALILLLKKSDITYLSFMLEPPGYIKQRVRPNRRYLLLYDTIPLSIPEYASHMSGWFGNVARNISAQTNYLAISEFTRRNFKLFFPVLRKKEIPVVYLAAAEYFRPIREENVRNAVCAKYHIPTGKKIFFSHCSLAPHKNLEMLFRAFVEFYKTESGWIMLFSGANVGEKMEKLQRIAQENEIPPEAFAFTGYVDDADLPVLYSISDVFCFVSLHEGFGLPVLEAMQCGCPCLVSNTTSIPEVTGDAAYLVDPQNLDDIVRGLRTVAANPDLRQQMSQKGIERAKHFSWEKTADQIIKSIKK